MLNQSQAFGYERDNLTVFEELLRSGDSIYVVNNTEPKGLLSTTINDPISGKSIKLEIPRTWLPFCLTAMLPRNVLEHNIELRRTLQKNVLKIMPKDQAVALLSSEKGRKEYARLMESEFAGGSRMDSSRKADLVNAVNASKQAVNSLDNPNVNYDEVKLHPKVRVWEQRIVTGEIDGSTLSNEIEIHKNELSSDDLQFLVTAQFPQEIKTLAQEMLNAGNFRTQSVVTSSAAPTDKYESDWDVLVK